MKRPGLLAIPAAAAAMLPVLGCPLCWPAYAALLSSVGLGFLGSPRYLFPVTAALLGVALAGLGIQARSRGFAPLILGAIAGGLILAGKFAIASNAMAYAGVAILIGASAASVLRGSARKSTACADCAAPSVNREPPDRSVSHAPVGKSTISV